MTSNQQIQLSWDDPVSGERREPSLSLPIAFGREFARMPTEHNGQRVARMILNSDEISRFHALLEWQQNELVITDQVSVNGIFVNGQRQTRSVIKNGDTLQIGPYIITITLVTGAPPQQAPSHSAIQFNPSTNLPDPSWRHTPQATPLGSSFPPALFQQQKIAVQALHATGLPVEEFDFLSVGGGLGSFIWADLLRISGVKTEKIIALGLEKEPYARYKRLCLNSQIPLYSTLR